MEVDTDFVTKGQKRKFETQTTAPEKSSIDARSEHDQNTKGDTPVQPTQKRIRIEGSSTAVAVSDMHVCTGQKIFTVSFLQLAEQASQETI